MSAPAFVSRHAPLVQQGLRAAVERIPDARMRRIAAYQLGWVEADGTPTEDGGGKGLRGALALAATEAAGADPPVGLPGAVAVELVHNFSLLHDDVMDHDVERRHRPTGWVAFGVGPAILAGTAMLTLAAQVLEDGAPAGLACLLDATQLLISGQSEDLRLETERTASMADVLRMESGKTAALLACAAAIGPTSAGAPEPVIDALSGYGHELGMAFQLVDDVLGIVGDPAATGKSASSDVRAGKRSAPIVAALDSDSDAGRRLREMFAHGPLDSEEEVAVAAKLVDEAGGIDWARREAEEHASRAHDLLAGVPLRPDAVADLAALARYVVERDR
jgi:geranylgeranyl diphosphate synthase type I